jgi:hypothetical protein
MEDDEGEEEVEGGAGEEEDEEVEVGGEEAGDLGKTMESVVTRRRGRPPAMVDAMESLAVQKVLEASRASARQRSRALVAVPSEREYSRPASSSTPRSSSGAKKNRTPKSCKSGSSSSGERASATFSNHFDLKPGERPELTIRVVADSEKNLVVNERFLKRYGSELPGGFPSEFPYRSKCVVMFQKVHGVDVIIFVMFVFEYGNDCPEPNRNRAYISYLDSVNYFRPRHLRTVLYHEVLTLYLDFIRGRGFRTAHIWACPPMKGDDYVLFCHPEDQKIPREDRLTTWYTDMLGKAKDRGVVSAVSNIVDEYMQPDKHLVSAIPFFEVTVTATLELACICVHVACCDSLWGALTRDGVLFQG